MNNKKGNESQFSLESDGGFAVYFQSFSSNHLIYYFG